jgi:hypothetical protein
LEGRRAPFTCRRIRLGIPRRLWEAVEEINKGGILTKRMLLFLAVLAAMLVAAVPASAVKFGTPDATNAYPWVGLMVAIDENGEPLWRCTGSLLSNDLFLTAGHCVYDRTSETDASNVVDRVYIWFDPGYPDPIPTDPVYLANLAEQEENPDADIDLCEGVTGYPCYDASGEPVPHGSFTGALTIPQTSDVGLVTDLVWESDADYHPTTYGTVAPVGYLDDLAYERGQGNVEFTVVGYGLQSVVPRESADKTRMIATVSLVNLRSALAGGWNLHYSNNPGQGHGGSGGTCFGDSGGPVIHDGVIVAVNSFVLNTNCAGAGFGYRVDTQYAHDFIGAND